MNRLLTILAMLVLAGAVHAAPSKYMMTQDTVATSDTTLFKVYGRAEIDSLTSVVLDSIAGTRVTINNTTADTLTVHGRAVSIGRGIKWGRADTLHAMEFGEPDSVYSALLYRSKLFGGLGLSANLYQPATTTWTRANAGKVGLLMVQGGIGAMVTANVFQFYYSANGAKDAEATLLTGAAMDTVGLWEFNGATGDSGISATSVTLSGGIKAASTSIPLLTGNVGIGVSPQSTHTSYTGLSLGGNANMNAETTAGVGKGLRIMQNAYLAQTGNYLRISADQASRYSSYDGNHYFATGDSGAAGAATTFSNRLQVREDSVVVDGAPTLLNGGLVVPAGQSITAGYIYADSIDGNPVLMGDVTVPAGQQVTAAYVNADTVDVAYDASNYLRLLTASNGDLTWTRSSTARGALRFLTTYDATNIGLGESALKATDPGEGNIAIGDSALGKMAGNYHIAIGSGTSKRRVSSDGTVVIGYQAAPIDTAGSGHAIFGTQAAYSLLGADYITAFGYKNQYLRQSGSLGTSFGPYAQYSDTASIGATSAGAYALYTAQKPDSSTAVGHKALYSTTTGKQLTALGDGAGYTNATGSGSVFLGHEAGYFETASNKLFIDNQRRGNEATGRDSALIYGVFDASPANQSLRFNGRTTHAQGLRTTAGSVATPAISYSSDTNSGFGWYGADSLYLSQGGSERWRFTPEGIKPGTSSAYDIGTALLSVDSLFVDDIWGLARVGANTSALATPSFFSVSDDNTGIQLASNDTIRLISGGGWKFEANANAVKCNVGFGGVTSAGAWPSMAGSADLNTGFSWLSNDTVTVTNAGTIRWRWNPNGDLVPNAVNDVNIGTAAAYTDTMWAKVFVDVADIPYLDGEDDLAALAAIRPSGEVDATGRPLVDDSTLPRSIMLVYAADKLDTLLTNVVRGPVVDRLDTSWATVRVKVDSVLISGAAPPEPGEAMGKPAEWRYAYRTDQVVAKVDTLWGVGVKSADRQVVQRRKGDLVIGGDGKPFFDSRAAIGQLQGAFRQQIAINDSLRAELTDIKARLAKLEAP